MRSPGARRRGTGGTHLLTLALIGLVVGACIVLPQRRTRQPIERWLDGFTLDRVESVTYCIVGRDDCEKPLPRERWPDLVELVWALVQLPVAESGTPRRKGFLYLWFGARDRVTINFYERPGHDGDPVVAWVHGGSKRNGYNAFDGSRLWRWLAGVAADVRAGEAASGDANLIAFVGRPISVVEIPEDAGEISPTSASGPATGSSR